ncbi:MAG: hypothetical protein J6P07_08095 [Spirochaetaceae bacterium]|nr:hypothetical protein [Spirochaetaceae bacterium]MBO7731863.1 hypothetical protein [Methanobrevibacter sp.]
MDNIKAMEIYNSLSRPPKDALKQITGGKLSGKTDINPQWRYKAMTEKFGLVGIGWKYEIQKLWTEQGAGGEVLAFAQVAVFVKDGESWGDPIIGIGGSKLVQIEKGQPVSNDEGFKMAVTDAFSTSLKMIGVAADIYAGRWDGSKYKDSQDSDPVEVIKNVFGGKEVPPKAPTFVPKGGPDTPEEKERIIKLLHYKNEENQLVFTKEEYNNFCASRKNFTAKEVIQNIVNELGKRGYLEESQEPPKQEEFVYN